MFLFSLLTFSCSKEDLPVDNIENSQVEKRSSRKNLPPHTILGPQRNNPFSLTNINLANSQLYGTNVIPKTKTHTYIRWEPQNYDDLAILEDWETDYLVAFFDTPLDYEILVHGEKYIDPAVTDSILTYQYSAVPLGIPIPNIANTELEDLYLDESDLLLLIQSFYITGNTSDINQDLLNGGLTQPQMNALSNSIGPGWPPFWFLFPPEDGCESDGFAWVLVEIENPGPGISPWSWNCVYVGLPPIYDNPNICGCQIPISLFRPAGCIRVEENATFFVGVQVAQVKIKDGWFNNEIVYSDENGCWRSQQTYDSDIAISIKFKNENVKVRDMSWSGAIPIINDNIGQVNAPINNIITNYDDFPNPGLTDLRARWAAAHTLNTVNTFRTAASNDNIPMPREDLNWTNAPGNGAASAPMLQGNAFSSWPAWVLLFLNPLGFPAYFGFTNTIAPDVTNRYANGELFDIFNGTAFHELGHVSHHALVGEDYWVDYRNHIINNLGYGEFGDFSSGSHIGHVALGEAVGNFCGAFYGGTDDGGDGNHWRDDANGNIIDGFIPQGLLWDLMDVEANPANDVVTDPNDNTISGPDNISGFTPEMLFNGLENSTSIREYRDELRVEHLGDTPNTEADYNFFVDLWDVFNN